MPFIASTLGNIFTFVLSSKEASNNWMLSFASNFVPIANSAEILGSAVLSTAPPIDICPTFSFVTTIDETIV